MAWNPVSIVYNGDPSQLKSLKGLRVRAKTTIMANEFKGDEEPAGMPFTIIAGQVGIVGFAVRDDVVLVFTLDPSIVPSNLRELEMKGSFRSFKCNTPTFRMQFDIER